MAARTVSTEPVTQTGASDRHRPFRPSPLVSAVQILPIPAPAPASAPAPARASVPA